MLLTEAATIMQTKPTAHTDMNTRKKTHTQDQQAAENVESVGGSGKTKWSCHSCKIAVTLFVAVQYPPTHICHKKAGRVIPLQKEGESNE
jgi:hypothetical protein